jgi:outer membrane protein assembly factor BamB
MKNKEIPLLIFIILLLSMYVPAETRNALAAANTQATSETDWWTMFHHDLTHAGYSNSTAPETNHVSWNYTNGNAEAWSSPAIANGSVYIGSDDFNIYCLNANTGSKIWNYTTGGPAESSPAVADDKVYDGSNDGNVYCLNASTGSKIWSYFTGGGISSPAIANGSVYIGSDYGSIYCLNASTGSEIWSYFTGGGISSPAIANGRVYIGSDDFNIYCLNANTGSKIWNYTTRGPVKSSPAIANGRVYIGSDDFNIYCLNANTGSKIWNYTTGDSVISSPALNDEKAYLSSNDGSVYCLDANTGSEIWSYFTGGGISSPAIANGRVYIGSDDFNIYCLNANTGSKIWNYTTQDFIWMSPAVADGKLYVGSLYFIYAFAAPPPTLQYRLAITAQPGGSVSYSYPGSSGTVSGGSTEVIYVPAEISVQLSAQPSSFLYQFNGWTGAITSSNGQVSLNVNSSTSVESAFGYNYANIGLIAIVIIAVVLAGSLALRRRKP